MKKIPTIEFRTSRIYNAQWTRPPELQEPPSRAEWQARSKKLMRLWTRHQSKILRTMSSITGLPWGESHIIVYLSWGIRPFSDPLTLNLRKDVDSVFDTLTHELIHRHISGGQNWVRVKRRWNAMVAKYPGQPPVATNHIPIHAIHAVLWQKLFPARVKIIQSDLKLAPYRWSWSIVNERGAAQIIEDIFGHAQPRKKRSTRRA